MLSVGTNIGSIYAKAAAFSAANGMDVAMERLATGKRINAAKDDAAGIAISSRMESNIRGLNQAVRNSLDAQALIDTAEGGIQEVEVILQRMRELAVQSANDTNSADDRNNLQLEMDQLKSQIDKIAKSTTWAGQNFFNGGKGNNIAYNISDAITYRFQLGAGSSETESISIQLSALTASALGIGGTVSGVLVHNNKISTSATIEIVVGEDGSDITIGGTIADGDIFSMHVNGEYISYAATSSDLMRANPQAAVTLGLVKAINAQALGVEAATPATKVLESQSSLNQSAIGVTKTAGTAEIQEITFTSQVYEIPQEYQVVAVSEGRGSNVVHLNGEDFLITWLGDEVNRYGGYGKIFYSDGSAGAKFLFTDDTSTFNGLYPQPQSLESGNFVIAFRDGKFTVRVFDSSSNSIKDFFTPDGAGSPAPAIAVGDDDIALLIWRGSPTIYWIDGDARMDTDAKIQIFDLKSLTALSDPIVLYETINDPFGAGVSRVNTKYIGNNSFFTVWDHEKSSSEGHIYGRLVNQADPAGGSAIRLDDSDGKDRIDPKIAVLSDASFWVFWINRTDKTVEGQKFDSAGLKIGSVKTLDTGAVSSNEIDVLTYKNEIIIHIANKFFIVSADGKDVNSPVPTSSLFSSGASFSISESGSIVGVGLSQSNLDNVIKTKYQIGADLPAQNYTLTAGGVTLSGRVQSPSASSLSSLVESFKLDPNYNPDNFTLELSDGKLRVNFTNPQEQNPVILQNNTIGEYGIVSELTAGVNAGAKIIDLSQMSLGDAAYVLEVGSITLKADAPNGVAHTASSLIAALKSDPNYGWAGFTLSETSGNLSVTFDDQTSQENVTLNNLPSKTLDLTSLTLEDETYNLRIGSDVLSVEPTGGAPFTISSLIVGFEADPNFNAESYSLAEVAGKLVVTFNGSVSVDVTFDNAGLAADTVSFKVKEFASTKDGLMITGNEPARSAILTIDQAMILLNFERSKLGSLSNRFDHIIANNTNALINAQASLGHIMDADYAIESTRLTKHKILQQSSVAMLAQANAPKQDILQLLDFR